jgi:glycosyltransferase involved in cell wall biosynthesis
MRNNKLKIAQVAPVMLTIPPQKYGGIERDTAELSIGLVGKGHSVTVFAAKGSSFNSEVKVVESSPFPTSEDMSQNRKWEIHQILQVLSMQDQFDIINLHYEPLVLRAKIENREFNLVEYFRKPIVVTFHNQTYIPENINYYKSHQELWELPYIFISESQRKPLNFFSNTEVIFNGIPVEKFEHTDTPEDYLLFLGRITPQKGILEAIQVAKQTGRKLIIAARIDAADLKFYEDQIKPLIDGSRIIYVGEVGGDQKIKLLRNSYAMIFPALWNEPLGLVMLEAHASGTPVIAFNKGSVPEVIVDGVTGFIVDNIEKMVKAVEKIPSLDRRQCRKRAEELFTTQQMVDKYEHFFYKVLS